MDIGFRFPVSRFQDQLGSESEPPLVCSNAYPGLPHLVGLDSRDLPTCVSGRKAGGIGEVPDGLRTTLQAMTKRLPLSLKRARPDSRGVESQHPFWGREPRVQRAIIDQ